MAQNDKISDTIEDESNPLYINISKRRYGILLEREDECRKLKRSMRRALQKVKVNDKE